jgi:hypothetical protein
MATITTTVNTISKTYAQLKTLRESSSLTPGQYYKITDFQTKWWNQATQQTNGYFVLTSPVVEPLNVLAIATNKFSNITYSDLYPTDIIYYNFEATRNLGMLYGTTIPDFKGWITRRIDTVKNIDISFDWRHMTVNCCRPNISNIQEWSATSSYSVYSVVKLNNKLYFSTISDNLNISPITDDTKWRPFSGYNEGLTYFPTQDSRLLNAYKHDGTVLISLVADTSTRIQKYIFDGSGPEQVSSGSNNLTNVSNITIEGYSFSNIFLGYVDGIKIGSGCIFNIIGSNFSNNKIGNSFRYNIISNYFYNNEIGDDFNENITNVGTHPSQRFFGNKFGSYTYKNLFGKNLDSNVFGSYLYNNIFGNTIVQNNNIGTNFYNNFLPATFRRNNVGNVFNNNNLFGTPNCFDNIIMGSFYNNTIIFGNDAFYFNVIFPSFYNNTIKGTVRQNTIQTNCFNNTLSGNILFNSIGTQFHYNNINGEFSYNTIAGSMSYNTIGNSTSIGSGAKFTYNNISEFFRNGTIGNNFRYNVVEAEALFNYGNLSSATHIYNQYSTRIFKNASGTTKLIYYNSSDVQVVVSPTA